MSVIFIFIHVYIYIYIQKEELKEKEDGYREIRDTNGASRSAAIQNTNVHMPAASVAAWKTPQKIDDQDGLGLPRAEE